MMLMTEFLIMIGFNCKLAVFRAKMLNRLLINRFSYWKVRKQSSKQLFIAPGHNQTWMMMTALSRDFIDPWSTANYKILSGDLEHFSLILLDRSSAELLEYVTTSSCKYMAVLRTSCWIKKCGVRKRNPKSYSVTGNMHNDNKGIRYTRALMFFANKSSAACLDIQPSCSSRQHLLFSIITAGP